MWAAAFLASLVGLKLGRCLGIARTAGPDEGCAEAGLMAVNRAAAIALARYPGRLVLGACIDRNDAERADPSEGATSIRARLMKALRAADGLRRPG